ncbi:MAG: SUMF1/EgtB/PvdO family nonheme iron enzyme, partial [Muribaculaceae bacterium]
KTKMDTQHLSAGTILNGKYRIIRFIGGGGFGYTYEAEHTLLETRVAIKESFMKDCCNREPKTSRVTVGTESKKPLVEKLRRKFIDEARALSKLNHAGIVRVSDVFEENGTAYFVMDYIDGFSLDSLLKQKGHLSEEEATDYIIQAAEVLEYVHSKNRLHLDIKPGNIMLTRSGMVILIDFGASKQYDEVEGENTSSLIGRTPGYAPPEQSGSRLVQFSPATDIYSLGATYYKLLTGTTPPESTLLSSGEVELEPLPGYVSEPVRRTVEKAMQIRRKDRFQSVRDFLESLEFDEEYEGYDEDEVTYIGEDVIEGGTYVEKPSDEDVRTSTRWVSSEMSDDEEPEVNLKVDQRWKRELGWTIVGFAMLLVIVVAVMMNLVVESSEEVAENSVYGASFKPEKFEVENVEFEMVKVQGGTFEMGATAEQGDDAFGDEKPAHSVKLSGYYIGKYEVTQAQWKAIMGNNPSKFKGDNLPVESVSWYDCQEFIRKLNKRTGKKFSLPTEAQWEYAARGGKRGGTKYSGSNDIDSVAWYDGNSGGKTHPVGTTNSPNDFGIYDMSGNVEEWCQDWYDSNYYKNSPTTNPTGPNSGPNRVYRGGSWLNYAGSCRVSIRSSNTPSYKFCVLGFRLCLSISE